MRNTFTAVLLTAAAVTPPLNRARERWRQRTITTRKFLGLGAALTIGTLLACANDINAPPDPVRVFTSLEMTPSALTLAPIQGLSSQVLWVRARDQYGMDIVGAAPSFSSSDPSVATVTRTGAATSTGSPSAFVTVVAPGEAEISASWTLGGVTKTAKSRVTVESTEGWSLKLDPLTLNVGSMHKVQATVLDKTGNARIQPPIGVAFTSDRDDVVALVEEWEDCYWGLCQAIYMLGVAPGEATITAEYGGLSGTTSVAVVP